MEMESVEEKQPLWLDDHLKMETKNTTPDMEPKHKVKNKRCRQPEKVNKDDNFTCDRCGKNLSSKDSLAKHIRYHDNIRPYKCRFCWKSYVEVKCLYRHISARHSLEEPLKCPLYPECDKTFWLDEMHERHMKWHDGKNRAMYQKGEVEKLDSAELNTEAIRKPLSDSLECHLCGKTLSTKGNLKTHIKRHYNSTNCLPCKFCGKLLRGQDSLDSHLKCHKEQTSNDELKCARCGKKLCSKASLARHMRYHDNVRPYSCRFCRKSYVELAHVYSHINLCHKDEEPIKCPYYLECGKTFWLDEMLDKHIQTHSGKKRKLVHKYSLELTNAKEDKDFFMETCKEELNNDDENLDYGQGYLRSGVKLEVKTVSEIVTSPEMILTMENNFKLNQNNLKEDEDFLIKEELNDDNEKLGHAQSYSNTGDKLEFKTINETITWPKTAVIQDNSDNKHNMTGGPLTVNKDSGYIGTLEKISEANIINIVPLDSSLKVETDNASEDITDPVIHNILPILEDQNSLKYEGQKWSDIKESPLKTENM